MILFQQSVASLDDNFIEIGQYIGGKGSHIVEDGLQGLALRRQYLAATEHLLQCYVLIDQIGQAVVVRIQVQTHRAQHQCLPQRHTGSTGVGVDLGGQVFFQAGEDGVAAVGNV